MPIYHQLGELPSKRHKIFRKASGELYSEELVGNMGFVGPSSLLYHVRRPTAVRALRTIKELHWTCASGEPLRHRHFRTANLQTEGDPALDRVPILFNHDVSLSVVRPTVDTSCFYRNAQGDEIVFITEGAGVWNPPSASIPFEKRRLPCHSTRRPAPFFVYIRSKRVLLVIESGGYVRTPKRYRNEYGQLMESSPYSERDIRCPSRLGNPRRKGRFPPDCEKGKLPDRNDSWPIIPLM